MFLKPGGIAYQIIFMLFVSTVSFSQENAEEKLLLLKANELAFSDPDETIKIANHLLKKVKSEENSAAINLLIARSYDTKGDYFKSVNYVFEASKKFRVINDSLKAEILFLKAEISRKLHLYNQVNCYLSDVEPIIDGLGAEEVKTHTQIRIELQKLFVQLERTNYKETLKQLSVIEQKYNATLTNNHGLKQSFSLVKALSFNGLNDYNASEKSFEKALSEYNLQKKTNIIFETEILHGLSKIYYERKEYKKSIDTLLMALEKATKINNLPLLEKINYQLAANYLALSDKTQYQKYNDKFLSLNTASIEMEIEAVNSMYNFIGEELEANYEYENDKLTTYTYIALTILILITLSFSILYAVNKAKRKRLKEIIGYLEVTNNLLVKSYVDKKEPNKKIAIPTETEQSILAKLKRFESSIKYTNKDMSLATLAAQFDVNTKYLSEIINKHYQDNFNTYINRLRINYIIEKLKNEPEYLNYKISYLADESGFSSHSSFATVFKSITGIAPTIFIDLIGKEVNKKKA